MNGLRPILFGAPMVQALLAGRKSQTRRVIKFKQSRIGDTPHDWAKSVHKSGGGNWVFWSGDQTNLPEFTRQAYPGDEGFKCPYGRVGDRLWVRESFIYVRPVVVYRADDPPEKLDTPIRWTPSIFMPKWASRITLEITDVRVQRLHEISCDDLIAEGAESLPREGVLSRRNDCFDSREGYKELWNQLNAKRGYSWESCPWVWGISFRRVPNESDA